MCWFCVTNNSQLRYSPKCFSPYSAPFCITAGNSRVWESRRCLGCGRRVPTAARSLRSSEGWRSQPCEGGVGRSWLLTCYWHSRCLSAYSVRLLLGKAGIPAPVHAVLINRDFICLGNVSLLWLTEFHLISIDIVVGLLTTVIHL